MTISVMTKGLTLPDDTGLRGLYHPPDLPPDPWEGKIDLQPTTPEELVDFAIARLPPDEAVRLLDLVRRRIDGQPPADEDWLAGESCSVSARLVAFYAAQGAAAAGGDEGLIRQADALRYRRRIEQLLLLRLAGDDAGADTAAPATAPAAADADDGSESDEVFGIRLIYRKVLEREAQPPEIGIWKRAIDEGLSFRKFVRMIAGSEEAQIRRRAGFLTGVDDGAFVEAAYRIVLGRGASPVEIELQRRNLTSGLNREGLLRSLFSMAFEQQRLDEPPPHDALSCLVMGTDRRLTLQDWQARAADKAGLAAARARVRRRRPYRLPPGDRIVVSAITSLYKGGDFIERFMDSMVGQTLFDGRAELIVIDANTPQGEARTIERYMKNHPGIVYRRTAETIGIYEAWNLGVGMARGRYLTNANLDDLRREDSFEIQAGALEAHPWVDVVYQDFYYTFDPRLSWDEVAAFGYLSDLPVISPLNMIVMNSPHHAPMWRKRLHDEMGLFDARMKSASDYEFWLRCLTAGKTFFKINEPHAVYYQNPDGLSTRPDTRGVVEGQAIHRNYVPRLISPNFLMDAARFEREVLHRPAWRPAAGSRYVAVVEALRDLSRRQRSAAAAPAAAAEAVPEPEPETVS
jgi:glycosyltransferase involved in cell wall biosynthesis